MMKRWICTLLLATALTSCSKDASAPKSDAVKYTNEIGANEKQVLADAGLITLRKIDSDTMWNSNRKGLSAYKTLSVTTLKNEQAHQAANAMLEAIQNGAKEPTNCVFVPDYALSVKAGRKTYDYLISYSCKQAMLLVNGVDVAWPNVEGSPAVFEALVKPDAVKNTKRKAKK